MRSPALQRTHAFMGSLIQDFVINVLSGVMVSVSGLTLRRLRQRHAHRRTEPTSTTNNSDE
ncbi:hypothetical protein [Streptomyces sp. NPDC002328]|uniref:hypothetical protein n=1 Tax=Streptomyces sp. NPDC002328 TaxID=3364642 RepID=UPI0036B9CA66